MMITQEEVRKVARISALALTTQEITEITHDLNAVITYAAGLTEVAALSSREVTPAYCEPYARPDEAHITNSAPLIALAPQTDNNYIVVPVIVKGSES